MKIPFEKGGADTSAFDVMHGEHFVLVEGRQRIRGYFERRRRGHGSSQGAIESLLAEQALDMSFGEALPSVNATLNGFRALWLLLGYWSIKKKHIALHGFTMQAAFVTSTIFLVCYLTRVYLTGTHRFPAAAGPKALYLTILLTHMTWRWRRYRWSCGRCFWLGRAASSNTGRSRASRFRYGCMYPSRASSCT